MATIKLNKPRNAGKPPTDRTPVRGGGGGVKRARPTLAEAQAQRAESEARYQEQLRQRFGGRPPEGFVQRGDNRAPTPRPAPPRRNENTAFGPRPGPQPARHSGAATAQHDPRDTRRAPDPRDARNRPDPRDPRNNGRDHDLRDPRGPRDPRGAHDARAPRDMQRAAPAPHAPHDPRTDPRREPPRDPRAAPRPAARFDPRPPARHAPPKSRDSRRPRDHDDDDDHYEHREHREHEPGSMRLSKRMSELGIASRREADEWIAKGYVRVDDRIVSELGSRVMPDQRVTIDAKAKFMQAQRVTVLVNKPVGYVSGQAEDGYEPAVVLVTPDNQWRDDRSGTRFLREHLKSLVPAGRLDIDSVGLLVLTQDGRIAKQLIGEETEIEKEYLVRVASIERDGLSDAGLALLRHGLELDGEALRPAQVEWVNDDQLRFVLSQGKKRQIRRMCDAVGLQVLGLKRVRVGKVMLGDLPPGQWRYLRADESFA